MKAQTPDGGVFTREKALAIIERCQEGLVEVENEAAGLGDMLRPLTMTLEHQRAWLETLRTAIAGGGR